MRSRSLQLLLLLPVSVLTVVSVAGNQSGHLRQLFDELDCDNDGQLRKQELRQRIGQLSPDHMSHSALEQAVDGALGRLDSPDGGLSVSWREFQQHLHTILQGVAVDDWVAHGLRLPQYAEAFRANAVTALDFPMLVSDGGKLLQSELKVESSLHRQQLLRAMQRQIWGLGAAPASITSLSCSSTVPADSVLNDHLSLTAGAGSAAATVVCNWSQPQDPGQPAMHKYIVERVQHSTVTAAWHVVSELYDITSVRSTDALTSPGVYQYRISAWNVYGRSPYTLSDDVVVTFSHLQQQQQAHTGSHALWLPAAPDSSQTGQVSALASSAEMQLLQHSDPHHDCLDRCPQPRIYQQQHPQPGVVQVLQPGDTSSSVHKESRGSVVSTTATASVTDQSCGFEMDLGGVRSTRLQASPDKHVRQQLHSVGSVGQPLSGSVVWFVDMDQQQPWQQHMPATSGGQEAHNQLAASIQEHAETNPQAARASFGLAVLRGLPWYSTVHGWLKAIGNSLSAFMLVVLPICVRFLPVQVLAQAAHVVAWVLQLLPAGLQQRLMPPSRAAQDQRLPANQEPGAPTTPRSADAHHWKDGFASPSTRSTCRSSDSCKSMLTNIQHSNPPSALLPSSTRSSLLLIAPTPIHARSVSKSVGPVQHCAASGVCLQQPLTASADFIEAPSGCRLSQSQQEVAGSSAGWPTPPEAAAAAASKLLLRQTGRVQGGATARMSKHMGRSVSAFDLMRQGGSLGELLGGTGSLRTSGQGPNQAAFNGSMSQRDVVGVDVRGTHLAAGGTTAATVAADGDTWDGRRGDAAAAAVGGGRSPLRAVCHTAIIDVDAGAVQSAIPSLMAPSSSFGEASGTVYSSSSALQQHAGVQESLLVVDAPSATSLQERRGQAVSQGLHDALYGHHNSSLPDNKRCGFPGCQQQFGLRHWKATMQRHYCGRCQQAFCLQHTAYSPHGPSGTCGVQSRCLCIDCFYEYTPEYQAFLACRNSLVGKRSKSGPPAGAVAALRAAAGDVSGDGGSSSHGEHAKPLRVLSRFVPVVFSATASSSRLQRVPQMQPQQQLQPESVKQQLAAAPEVKLPEMQLQTLDQEDLVLSAATPRTAHGAVSHRKEVHGSPDGDTAGSWTDRQHLGTMTADGASGVQSLHCQDVFQAAGAGSHIDNCSRAGLKSRMLWSRGLTKALGVVRFKQAVTVHALTDDVSQAAPERGH